MSKIYRIILACSLGSAIAAGLFFLWTGYLYAVLITGLTFVSVWLGFLICRLAIRWNFTPDVIVAMATGLGLGLLCALVLGGVPGFPLFGFFGLGTGSVLSWINYLIWADVGIIKELIQRDDEAKYGTVRH